ncbi:MAG: tetratricopeptide repeat protein [Phycisphaerales bacterium]|nr:tetratricopeptide repeat protein [Phycisphaerales bacterium]
MEPINDWNDAERRVERAARLFEQRKLDEALEELQIAVEINPFNAGWLCHMAITLEELGRFEQAIAAYRQALDLEPSDLTIQHRLGVALQRAGRLRQAIEVFDHIERSQPDFEPAYCHRLACYCELGDHDSAEQMFYMGRLVKEHCPACYFHMGCSLAARRDWDRAIYCWRRTLDLQPAHPMVHQRLAHAYWRRGELERARRHLAARWRHAPRDYPVLMDLCRLLIEMGRVEEAGERLEALPPAAAENSPHVQFATGLWHLARGNPGESALAFSRALQLDPTFPRAHLHLGQIHLLRGENIEAKTHLRSELMLRPDDVDTLRDLSNLLIDIGETRSAITCLRRIIAINPDDLAAWQNLGVAHFLRSQHEAGISACRRLLTIAPGYLPGIYNLAMALGELQRFDEALAVLRSAPTVYQHDLADLALRLRVLRLKSRFIGMIRHVFRRARG